MDRLNGAQRGVVREHENKNMCVIACAGSGKTTTIIYRIWHLIKNHGVPSANIILTTFTRNAAHDMSAKLKAVCGEGSEKVNIGTLDSLSQRAMRHQHRLCGDNTKYDFTQYQRLFYDFLLTERGQAYASSFRHFFFDEFQDANEIQYEILRQFYRAGVTVTVIGDDCQNIYSFRGSNMQYLIEFSCKFDNVALHMLNSNYRSTPEIVRVANECIGLNRVQVPKKMIPECKPYIWKGAAMKPIVQYMDSVYDECDSVVHWIKREYSRYIVGCKLHEICVMSHNHRPLKVMETALCKAGIDCVYIDNDDKQFVDSKYFRNKVFLCSVHQSKGLEWSVVFAVGFSDHYFPMVKKPHLILESRRLFYVAVTRAKKALHILYSGTFVTNRVQFGSGEQQFTMTQSQKAYPTRFIQELTPSNFLFVNTDPAEFEVSKKSLNVIKTFVTDLIRGLGEAEYNALRGDFFIGEAGPSDESGGTLWRVEQLYEPFKHSIGIKRNYAQALFGQFVENLLHRMFGNYRDHAAEGIINFYPLEPHENQIRNMLIDKLGVEIKVWIYVTPVRIRAEMGAEFTQDQIATTLGMLDKIRRHAERLGIPPEQVYVCSMQEAPTQDILDRLIAAYARYQNKDIEWRDILMDIYLISLSHSAVHGRLGAFYSKVTLDDLLEYREMYENIWEHYVERERAIDICGYLEGSISMNIEVDGVVSQYGTVIMGEADMIVNGRLVDVKCYSNSPLSMSNVAQIMVYYEMWENKMATDPEVLLLDETERQRKNIDSLQLFNPLLGQTYTLPMNRKIMGDRAIKIMRAMIVARDANIDRVENIDDAIASIANLRLLMDGSEGQGTSDGKVMGNVPDILQKNIHDTLDATESPSDI